MIWASYNTHFMTFGTLTHPKWLAPKGEAFFLDIVFFFWQDWSSFLMIKTPTLTDLSKSSFDLYLSTSYLFDEDLRHFYGPILDDKKTGGLCRKNKYYDRLLIFQFCKDSESTKILLCLNSMHYYGIFC